MKTFEKTTSRSFPTTRVNSAAKVGIIGLVLLGLTLGMISMTVNPNYFFAAAGICSFALVLLPLVFQERYDLFSPWTAAIIAVIYGNLIPAVCITLRLPDPDYVDQHILLFQEPEYFFYPTGLLLLSLGLFALGYFLPIRMGASTDFLFKRRFSKRRVFFIVGLSAITSLASFVLYIRNTGGNTDEISLSGKRTVIRTLEVQNETEFSQFGYLRQGSALAFPACLVLISAWLGRKNRPSIKQYLCIDFLFMLACAFPFYSSSRDQIAWNFLGVVGVLYYLKQDIFSVKLVSVACIAFMIIVFMTLVRNESSEQVSMQEKLQSKLTPLLLNRHGPNVAKTGHIVQNVPNVLPFEYGKTIFVWLLAPVPRDLFPSKPLISPGPIIGTEIYGTAYSGVPPGFIAELFWNFNVAGIILGSPLIGLALRQIYLQMQKVNSDLRVVIPVYFVAVFPLSFQLLNNCIGGGFVMGAVDFVMAFILVLACTRRSED